jgi:Ca2+-binding RTX toxin-like protein
VALLLSTMGLALLMAAGAAYAMDVIQCGPSHATPCLGTEAPDVMKGTANADHIVGLDEADEIHGLAAPDRLAGDGNFTVPGDDKLFGGPGFDTLFGGAGSDLPSGGEDGDQISADFLFNDGTDTVRGGSGNDTVNAAEGAKDLIYCGEGRRDTVTFDAGLDRIKNCEIKDAIQPGA